MSELSWVVQPALKTSLPTAQFRFEDNNSLLESFLCWHQKPNHQGGFAAIEPKVCQSPFVVDNLVEGVHQIWIGTSSDNIALEHIWTVDFVTDPVDPKHDPVVVTINGLVEQDWTIVDERNTGGAKDVVFSNGDLIGNDLDAFGGVAVLKYYQEIYGVNEFSLSANIVWNQAGVSNIEYVVIGVLGTNNETVAIGQFSDAWNDRKGGPTIYTGTLVTPVGGVNFRSNLLNLSGTGHVQITRDENDLLTTTWTGGGVAQNVWSLQETYADPVTALYLMLIENTAIQDIKRVNDFAFVGTQTTP